MSKKFTRATSGGILGEVTEDWNLVLPPGATFYWRMKPPKSKVKHVNMEKGGAGDVDQKKTEVALDREFLQGRMATTNQLTPPPRLEPMNHAYMTGGNSMAVADSIQINPSTHVNIKDEHHWTESPMTARGEVPVLSLKEYDVLQNAGVNQILQNMGVTLGSVDAASQNLNQLVDFFMGMSKDGGLEEARKMIMSKADSFETTEGAVTIADNILGSADPMQVYKGLYSRSQTGFKYSLPYMEDMQFKTSGGFTEDPHSMGGFMGMMNDASEFMAKFSGALAGRFLEPGRYIEKPKNFTFDGRQKSYTVKFPLFNTKSYNEVIKNWQFLFLITYQNTPGRVTKDVIQPPVQYEAYIPGSWYSRYTSITDMTVNFKGARREMQLPVPFLDRTTTDGSDWLLQKRMIRAIIPDAYEVSLTLTEIFGETQNTLYHMLAQSTDSKIITGELSPRIDNDVMNGLNPGGQFQNMNMDTNLLDNMGGMRS